MAVWFWNFLLFSFLGWCVERLFAALTRAPQQRRRCLLLLPLCPVYGLGMAAVWLSTSTSSSAGASFFSAFCTMTTGMGQENPLASIMRLPPGADW